MHIIRSGRLSGATAQRLLDGGDGPPPLPQLLAAATAPATAAELRGEEAARAAFRCAEHTSPLPHDIPRRSPVRTTSAIMIAKVIAAITLTASTAGGVALATTSTPTDPHTRATSESAATDHDAASPLELPTASPTGADADGADTEADAEAAEDALLAGRSDRPGGAGTAARMTPTPQAPHATGLCRAASNLSADHPGKAADSPAFRDLSCADTADSTGTSRPTDRPPVAPGNPDQHTGKPETAGNAQDGAEAEDKADKTEKAGKKEDPSDAQADGGGNADRGKSGEHRQDG
jgi:hypothetical protein